MPDLHETINQFLEGSIASIGRDPIIESKSITANGTYTAPEGVDGYSPITVNVPTPTPVIESKSITANGTYTAPEGVDGYSPITVNVPLPQNAYLLKSVSNLPQAIASFNDGEDMVMPTLKVAIEPQQEGSGDPSPTNVRPISGWSNCVISVANAITDPTVEHTYTIDLDGTRYGGTLDVVSGTLVVGRVIVDIDGSENGWSTDQVGTQNRRRFTCTGLPSLGTSEDITFDAISNMFVNTKSSNYINMNNVFILRYLSQYRTNRIDIMTETYQDLTAFKSFLSNSNLTVVYELATPITYQLTPTAVKSLLGVNNIWADTGDITDAEYFSKEE